MQKQTKRKILVYGLLLTAVFTLVWLLSDAVRLAGEGLFQADWSLNEYTATLLPTLWGFRYAALFTITFGASLGFPLPAAPSTIAAAAFASQGYLDIWLVFAANALGSICGDITMYWIIRVFGRRALALIGLKRWLNSPALESVEQTVDKYSAPVIVASRFQVQTTGLINILAGIASMNFRKFALLITAGELLQAVFYTSLGYFFAESWQALYELIGKFGWIIAILLTAGMTLASKKIINKIV